jgi:site-specific recombinase XerD
MQREGARPEVVRDNLGHANIGVTQVFFIVSEASFSSLRRNGIKNDWIGLEL